MQGQTVDPNEMPLEEDVALVEDDDGGETSEAWEPELQEADG